MLAPFWSLLESYPVLSLQEPSTSEETGLPFVSSGCTSPQPAVCSCGSARGGGEGTRPIPFGVHLQAWERTFVGSLTHSLTQQTSVESKPGALR